MPQRSKKIALKRAKRLGFPKSSVTKAKKGGYYIAPHGVKSSAGKKAYAESRARGMSKTRSAKIAHHVESRSK